MIRIVVVGSGGSVPSRERAMPCIAMKYDRVFLLDIGEGTQRELIRNNIPYGSVEAIFITHLHLDHYLGLYGLLETLDLMGYQGNLKIFAPLGFRMIKRFGFVEHIPVEKEGEIYSYREFRVNAFRTEHGCDSYGFRVKFNDKTIFSKEKLEELGIKGRMVRELISKGEIRDKDGKTVKLETVSSTKKGFSFAYSGDTLYSRNVVKNSQDCDLLFHDCTFMPPDKEIAQEHLHASLEDCKRIMDESNAEKMVLVHLSGRYRQQEVNRFINESGARSITASQDGMEFMVKY